MAEIGAEPKSGLGFVSCGLVSVIALGTSLDVICSALQLRRLEIRDTSPFCPTGLLPAYTVFSAQLLKFSCNERDKHVLTGANIRYYIGRHKIMYTQRMIDSIEQDYTLMYRRSPQRIFERRRS